MYVLGMLVHQHEENSFLAWMRETNQLFTGEEYHFRLGIWLSNKRRVQEHNSANKGFTLSMNHLASLTPAEYKSIQGFRPISFPSSSSSSSKGRTVMTRRTNAAEEVDWRTQNVVNDIQDQGHCGSCWAFSAIQAAESGWAIKTGTLLKLSEQNLVDCDTGSSGCRNGLMTSAYNWVLDHQDGHFMLSEHYPYHAKVSSCKYNPKQGIAKLVRYIEIVERSEEDLASKVENAPVAVALDASNDSFQLYSKGIYNEPSCTEFMLSHAVGVIGYGKEGSTAYWIIRNSWGILDWGDAGYMRLIKDHGNHCGVASMACQPQF